MKRSIKRFNSVVFFVRQTRVLAYFPFATSIAQFHIPGRTGASCKKTHQSEAKAGKNESMRALELMKHCCCALNCTTSTQKTKNVEKYLELANVRCFAIPQDNVNKSYAAGMSERERRMQWIAACRLARIHVCSVHFKGGLDPTKLNPASSLFAFPQHLR